jgi:hypothetical protein
MTDWNVGEVAGIVSPAWNVKRGLIHGLPEIGGYLDRLRVPRCASFQELGRRSATSNPVRRVPVCARTAIAPMSKYRSIFAHPPDHFALRPARAAASRFTLRA